MSNQPQLNVTSFDHEQLKNSLIEYMKTKEEFSDFDYEGSAINTIIDLLVRDSHYTAYLANMLANESFLSTAQIRGNVVSHAQKLSYTPRSRTAARAVVDLTITPSGNVDNPIIYSNPGVTFIGSIGLESGYTFTTTDRVAYTFNNGVFVASNVEIYQGQLIRNVFTYSGEKITIPNRNTDTSTLRVTVKNGTIINYAPATSITELGPDEAIYFLRESQSGLFEIEFGKNILGVEPNIGSEIEVSYINTESNHANGSISLVPAFSVEGYSNISLIVKEGSYGGKEREDTESVRFNAPRMYQNQDRALSPYDYSRIVKDNFTFIDSVISWGGEDNEPPRYGSVYVSILPQAGLTITRSLRTRIENTIKQKGVGSVTPIVVIPNIFDINLNVKYSFNPNLTTNSRKTVEAELIQKARDYGVSIRDFGTYYNQSQLIADMKDSRYVESVIVDETMSIDVTTTPFTELYYYVNFMNSVVDGSFSITNFSLGQSNESIYDADGSVIYQWEESSNVRTMTIGTIDYDTGMVEIKAEFVQVNEDVVFACKVDNENIYSTQNNVLQIGSVDVEELIR